MKIIDSYAIRIKSDNLRINSQSGGAFVLLSDYILEQNGIVYGCVLTNNFEVSYSRAENKSDRNKMLLSKYVQSNLKDTFSSIKNDLKTGKLVLFVGTPCHCSGLSLFLKNSKVCTDKLFLVDIICHGVPSQGVWKKSIIFLTEKFGNINSYIFRNKKYGWKSSVCTFEVNGKEYIDQTYNSLFYRHFLIRPCCFECKFRNIDRDSDFIIGDCWGNIQKYGDFFNKDGNSLIICNTDKSKILFEKISNNCEYIKVDILDFLQPALKDNYKKPLFYNTFWRDYEKNGYNFVVKKYCDNKLYKTIKLIMKKLKI